MHSAGSTSSGSEDMSEGKRRASPPRKLPGSGVAPSRLVFLHRNLYSFFMTVAEAEPLPITEASRRGVSKLVADAENGHATILRRHGEPVAAVISYRELQRLQALERDLVDVALVLLYTSDAADDLLCVD